MDEKFSKYFKTKQTSNKAERSLLYDISPYQQSLM